MQVSVLLRVALEPLDAGRVAGRAEIVDTGETAIFRDADELLAFVQAVTHARPAGHNATPSRQPASGGGK